MHLSLIGMSNVGKSHWAKKLEIVGFRRFCCDDLIESELGEKLTRRGYEGIADVAKWMGQPYDVQYPKTSRSYLSIERRTMEDCIKLLESKRDDNIVIDTTGSVIYTGEEIMDALRRLTTVVYLDTPGEIQDEMYRIYLKNPKPVIWGKSFSQEKNESPGEALARCYPELLAYRTEKYKEYAHVALEYAELRTSGMNTKRFLSLVARRRR